MPLLNEPVQLRVGPQLHSSNGSLVHILLPEVIHSSSICVNRHRASLILRVHVDSCHSNPLVHDHLRVLPAATQYQPGSTSFRQMDRCLFQYQGRWHDSELILVVARERSLVQFAMVDPAFASEHATLQETWI